MHRTITEVILSLDKEPTILPNFGVKIRLEDEGGGQYIMVEAYNLGQCSKEQENAICLETHEEIDFLAAELHRILGQH